jgi:hypothetical protein
MMEILFPAHAMKALRAGDISRWRQTTPHHALLAGIDSEAWPDKEKWI